MGYYTHIIGPLRCDSDFKFMVSKTHYKTASYDY